MSAELFRTSIQKGARSRLPEIVLMNNTHDEEFGIYNCSCSVQTSGVRCRAKEKLQCTIRIYYCNAHDHFQPLGLWMLKSELGRSLQGLSAARTRGSVLPLHACRSACDPNFCRIGFPVHSFHWTLDDEIFYSLSCPPQYACSAYDHDVTRHAKS